jgi:hypothetical protein
MIASLEVFLSMLLLVVIFRSERLARGWAGRCGACHLRPRPAGRLIFARALPAQNPLGRH